MRLQGTQNETVSHSYDEKEGILTETRTTVIEAKMDQEAYDLYLVKVKKQKEQRISKLKEMVVKLEAELKSE